MSNIGGALAEPVAHTNMHMLQALAGA